MIGTLQKCIAASNLQCSKCIHFRDDDPDIYYCNLHQPEFAGLCDQYEYHQSSYVVENRNKGILISDESQN